MYFAEVCCHWHVKPHCCLSGRYSLMQDARWQLQLCRAVHTSCTLLVLNSVGLLLPTHIYVLKACLTVLQGIVYALSMNSGDHRIEVPVVLCSDLDPKVLFWAAIAPPLVIYSFSRFLYRPLRRRHKLKKVCFCLETPCLASSTAFASTSNQVLLLYEARFL